MVIVAFSNNNGHQKKKKGQKARVVPLYRNEYKSLDQLVEVADRPVPMYWV